MTFHDGCDPGLFLCNGSSTSCSSIPDETKIFGLRIGHGSDMDRTWWHGPVEKLLGINGSNPGPQEARFGAKANEHGTGLRKEVLDLSYLSLSVDQAKEGSKDQNANCPLLQLVQSSCFQKSDPTSQVRKQFSTMSIYHFEIAFGSQSQSPHDKQEIAKETKWAGEENLLFRIVQHGVANCGNVVVQNLKLAAWST